MTNAAEFGLHPANSAAGNLSALRRAVRETPPGGTLTIPLHPRGAAVIDTSGGLSAAVDIDRSITVRLDGILRASVGERRANPPYLFRVSGRNVAFEGRGTLAGPGTFDDLNVQEEGSFPGLVFVTGDGFRWIGPTISDPPKVGIFLWQCHDATISGIWRGGLKTYTTGHTAYFGIRATGGGWHHILDNDFGPDATGGRLITAFFNGGDHGGATACTIHGNRADVHEKLAYLWGDHHDLMNCTILNADKTDVIRLNGSNNRVHRVVARNVRGGVSIYGGRANEVSDCRFLDVLQAGIYVASTPGYSGGFDDTAILRNEIRAAVGAPGVQDGILLNLGGSDSRNIRIEDNEISGFGTLPGQAQIRVQAAAPYIVRGLTVTGNRLRGGRQAGILLRSVVKPALSGNTGTDLKGPMLWQPR